VTLAETQELFRGLVTGEVPLEDDRLADCFRGSVELPARDRLAIYRNMYGARLVDGLRETFPALAGFLGHDRFESLALDYVAAHPSDHHDVGRIGRLLPGFLRMHPDPFRPDLADLAELELTRNEVFFAPDGPAVGPEVLAGEADAAAVRLRMAGTLRVAFLAHDAAALWRSLASGAAVDLPVAAQTTVAIWRRGFDVLHCPLPQDEGEALRGALQGDPLGTICASFGDRPDPATAAHAAISSWFLEGWVAALRSA
jgi:hypothetical protein